MKFIKLVPPMINRLTRVAYKSGETDRMDVVGELLRSKRVIGFYRLDEKSIVTYTPEEMAIAIKHHVRVL